MTDEPGAGLRSPFDFEAPVWWDPKAREVIMKPRTFEPSLLVVHGSMALLVTGEAAVLSAEMDRVTISFPGQFGIPACDVRHDGSVFRFYFCMPHPKVFEFDQDTVRSIAKVLDEEGWGGPPELARIPVARMMSHTTLHVGKKRLERLQGLLG
jgi:hypothetical protein